VAADTIATQFILLGQVFEPRCDVASVAEELDRRLLGQAKSLDHRNPAMHADPEPQRRSDLGRKLLADFVYRRPDLSHGRHCTMGRRSSWTVLRFVPMWSVSPVLGWPPKFNGRRDFDRDSFRWDRHRRHLVRPLIKETLTPGFNIRPAVAQ
jgi:hypothetical protein